MSNKIQKAAYVFSFLALLGVAFFGFSTVASAQYSDEYYYGNDYSDVYYGDDYYYDYGDYDSDYYYNDFGYNPYSDYGSYYNDYVDYNYGYNDYCGNCDYGYDYGYYDTCYNCDYDYGYNDTCYSCYDYEYPDYAYCGSGCSSGSTEDIIIDIRNNNVNNNSNVNIVGTTNDYDHDDDDDNNDDEDFDVICYPDDRTVEEGDRVEWRAEVDGVDEDDVDFEWSGDADGDDQEVTERYTREGTYRARVTAEYRGETESATCTVEVDDDNNDDDDDRVTLVSNPPTGTPASLNSVYLSQVPYTGAAENAKLIGFITMLGLASIAGAYYIVTRKARADRKSFLERFKQDNLASKA